MQLSQSSSLRPGPRRQQRQQRRELRATKTGSPGTRTYTTRLAPACCSGGAANSSSSSSSEDIQLPLLYLPDGDVVSLGQQCRNEVRPSLELSREAAVQTQLDALKRNSQPYRDHGIEVLYRFSSFDPFLRSNYFGRSLDLGQFERFRRIVLAPPFSLLLEHDTATFLSSLEVSDRLWKQRVLVTKAQGGEVDEAVFEWTLVQRLGGCYDGLWFTESLKHDGDSS